MFSVESYNGTTLILVDNIILGVVDSYKLVKELGSK